MSVATGLRRATTDGRARSTVPGGSSFDVLDGRWRQAEQALAVLVVFLLGWRELFHYQVTYGVIAALALAPLWIGVLRKFAGARLLLLGCLVALLGGSVLALTADASGRSLTRNQFLADSSLFVLLPVTVAFLLYARTVLSERTIAVTFGLGVGLRLAESGIDSTNPWKFFLAIPLTIIVLAVADQLRRPVWTVVAVLALGVTSAFLDSRSLFATFGLAAVLLVWQLRPSRAGRRVSWVWTVALAGLVAAAIYNLAVSLLVDGYFGEEARQRTEVQIQSAGSLILGGRPEAAATRALLGHDPFGFGFGVAPNATDISVAKQGMLAINYNPYNNYVDRFMFGGHVELHSTLGDFWARAGIPGVLLGVVVVVLVARIVTESLHRRECSGLVVFFSCYTAWNLLFSPFYSAIPTLVLTLGLGLPPIAADIRRRRSALPGPTPVS